MNDSSPAKKTEHKTAFKTYINILCVLVLAIIIAVGMTAYMQLERLRNTYATLGVSNLIIQSASNLLYQIADIEISTRNYLLTNKESYVSRIKGQSSEIMQLARKLQKLTDGESRAITQAVSDRLSILNKVAKLKMNDTLLATDIEYLARDSEGLLDNISQDSDIIYDNEISSIKNITQLGANDIRRSQIWVALGSILGFVLLLIGQMLFNIKSYDEDYDNQDLINLETLNRSLVELKEKNEKISVLLEMSDVMLASENIKELSKIIANYCGRILNFSNGLFYIMHASKNYLEAMGSWGSPKAIEHYFTVDDCWSIRLGHIYEADTANNELICPHVKKSLPKSENNFSCLCIPLRARNDIFGLLYVEIVGHQANENILSENQRLLVNSFTELAALALGNIYLRNSLQYQSVRDPLTSLYNRRYLEEFLTKQLLQAERTSIPVAILMIDIDNFKTINDTYGHDAGDAAIKELAILFMKDIRPGDTAARYGGEEFTLVLYNVTAEVARQRAEKLREGAAQIRVKPSSQVILSLTISIGIAMYPQDGVTSEDLVRTADQALYFAKNSGKNRIILAGEMT